jgi:hypothetical protein
MRSRRLPAITAFLAAAIFSLTAMAEGPGRYTVTGTNNKDKTNYQGTATITKVGNSTWQIVEIIGDDTIEGFGIGDGKVIAASYPTDAGTTLALYIANSDGTYTGIWAGEDDKDINTETLKPQ